MNALAKMKNVQAAQAPAAVRVRRVQAADIPQVVGLDTRVTKLAKAEYWDDVFRRYGKRRLHERFFLVADMLRRPDSAARAGFHHRRDPRLGIGSTPCGWVFALSVEPDVRLHNVGSAMLDAIAVELQESGRQQDADNGGKGWSSADAVFPQRRNDGLPPASSAKILH